MHRLQALDQTVRGATQIVRCSSPVGKASTMSISVLYVIIRTLALVTSCVEAFSHKSAYIYFLILFRARFNTTQNSRRFDAAVDPVLWRLWNPKSGSKFIVSLVSISDVDNGAITREIKHAIKLKTSPARLAQLLQPSLAFCFSLLPMTAHPDNNGALNGAPSLAAS